VLYQVSPPELHHSRPSEPLKADAAISLQPTTAASSCSLRASLSVTVQGVRIGILTGQVLIMAQTRALAQPGSARGAGSHVLVLNLLLLLLY
jgi:hypothetical protein